MRELIERNVFCGVTYQRSVFIDRDGFVIGIGEWKPVEFTPISNSYNCGDVCGSSYVGGVCGPNIGGSATFGGICRP